MAARYARMSLALPLTRLLVRSATVWVEDNAEKIMETRRLGHGVSRIASPEASQ